MRLRFKYDIDKDVENFINGSRSVNSSKPTTFHLLYAEKHGMTLEPAKARLFIEAYLSENKINPAKEVAEIERAWLAIADRFIERCELLFGLTYPREVVDVYLTTNNRCTYSIRDSYFFVRMRGYKQANSTIMHELIHFYTQEAFHDRLMARGLTGMQYNDIKESLTELLNVEFADLMEGGRDDGYPQHAEMRKRLRELLIEGRSLSEVVDELAKPLQI